MKNYYEKIKQYIAEYLQLRKMLKPSDPRHAQINKALTELYDMQYNFLQYAKIK